jgi:hypothetical protein
MFGVVAPHDDQLALAVEVEGVDNAETRLTRSSARHAQPPSDEHPEDRDDKHGGNKEGEHGKAEHDRLVVHQGIHRRHDRSVSLLRDSGL